jgi:hypothetical protein
MRYALPASLAQQPFTVEQALVAGLSRDQLAHPRFRRVFRAVYVGAAVPDSRELRLAAARLVVPARGVLVGLTAAWVHGVDVRSEADLDVHVGFPAGGRIRSQPGLRVSQESLDTTDVEDAAGVRVTTPCRTAFDCLRLLADPEGIVVADALLRRGCLSPRELSAYFAGKHGTRGLRRGARLLADVEPNTDSPMETRTRVLLVRGGAGRPEAPVYVMNAGGDFLGRLDMGYPLLKLGIEYDGFVHWKQAKADERRRAAMRAAGWEIIVLHAEDIYAWPEQTVARVIAAKQRRARELGVTG